MFDFDGFATLGLYDPELDSAEQSPALGYLDEIVQSRMATSEVWGLSEFGIFWKFWCLGSHNRPGSTLDDILQVFSNIAKLDIRARGCFSFVDDESRPETVDGRPILYLLRDGRFWLERDG